MDLSHGGTQEHTGRFIESSQWIRFHGFQMILIQCLAMPPAQSESRPLAVWWARFCESRGDIKRAQVRSWQTGFLQKRPTHSYLLAMYGQGIHLVLVSVSVWCYVLPPGCATCWGQRNDVAEAGSEAPDGCAAGSLSERWYPGCNFDSWIRAKAQSKASKELAG